MENPQPVGAGACCGQHAVRLLQVGWRHAAPNVANWQRLASTFVPGFSSQPVSGSERDVVFLRWTTALRIFAKFGENSIVNTLNELVILNTVAHPGRKSHMQQPPTPTGGLMSKSPSQCYVSVSGSVSCEAFT